MTVARILDEKGSSVLTVRPTTSLADVVAALAEGKVGAVVVTEGDAIHGILSERDIVRALAQDGGTVLDKPAGDYMTRNVVTCRPEATVAEIMTTMTGGRFRHLPVMQDGKLAGIVSIGDVVKRRIEDAVREAEQIREYITTA